MNLLEKTKTYLVGHMQYANGRDWRAHVEKELEALNITTFNPYRKPFVKDVEEDENARQKMAEDMANGHYSDVAKRMSVVRSYDFVSCMYIDSLGHFTLQQLDSTVTASHQSAVSISLHLK